MNFRTLLHFQTAAVSASKSLAFGMSKVATETITAAGSGYKVNDQITVAAGSPRIPGVYLVTDVDGSGGVLALRKVTSYYVATASKTLTALATTGGTGTGLTVTLTFTDDVLPDGCVAASFQADTQAIRWRDDAVAPTSSVGFLLAAGAPPVYYDGPSLANVRAIQVTSGGLLGVSFYGK